MREMELQFNGLSIRLPQKQVQPNPNPELEEIEETHVSTGLGEFIIREATEPLEMGIKFDGHNISFFCNGMERMRIEEFGDVIIYGKLRVKEVRTETVKTVRVNSDVTWQEHQTDILEY